jgi:hypothetical protein
MDTIQRLDALWELHALILIPMPMTQAPIGHPKPVDCPSLRRCHGEASTNCHSGDAHALERKEAEWHPIVMNRPAIAEFGYWLVNPGLEVP